jgi:hypothetical protein
MAPSVGGVTWDRVVPRRERGLVRAVSAARSTPGLKSPGREAGAVRRQRDGTRNRVRERTDGGAERDGGGEVRVSDAAEDPRCPECGGPIGVTATYCMHCSADLTEEREAADTDDDGAWDEPGTGETGAGTGEEGAGTDAPGTAAGPSTGGVEAGGGSGELLDDDGLVDNTLTVLIGLAGGVVVGLVGTGVLLAVTGSGSAVLFGLVVWLGSTAYLVRRGTVQEAVSKGGYVVAAVLLLVPLVAVSPVVDVEGGLEGRIGGFVVLLVLVAVPAGIAAAVGFVASRFVPDGGGGAEG